MTLGCSPFGNLLSDLNLMTGSPLIWMVTHPFFLALRCCVADSEISCVRFR